jgi:twitching motility two-component system response regulator PilG
VKKAILVLDDDENTRQTILAIFEGRGYEVVACSNVPEAISAVRREHVDLALVDIKMPIVDGYEFCEFLRKTDKYSNIAIVIVTGEEERYGREEAESLKIEAFIDKPFKPMELVAKVEKILAGA